MSSIKKQNMKQVSPIIFVSLFFLIGMAGFMRPTAVYAAGLIVDSISDTVANDGACTLREAITNANNDDQSGSTDCTAGNGADTITFSIDGTITLSTTLPEITSEMTLDGVGQAITISGDNAVRVILVNASGTLTLNNLTIADGYAGEFVDGGGIHNYGILTVNNSTFSGNSAGFSGGAIANRKTATIINSTFSGNSDYAISHSGYNAGTMIISNSTIVGNSGGFVYTYSGATIQNSIVANNGTDCYEPIPGSILTADSSNMDSDGSCANATTQTPAQLNLGILADNGGETQTIALLAGSTAINHIAVEVNGCGSSINTDQRGVGRPVGSGCEVGAYEFEPCSGYSMTVANEAELNDAITCFNQEFVPETLTASTSAYTITLTADITLITSTLPIANSYDTSLQINGNDHIIDGADTARHFTILDSAVTLADLTLQNGNAPADCGGLNLGVPQCGGAIRVESAAVVTLTQTSILTSTASLGGGLFNHGGIVTVNNSIIASNSGSYRGGGVVNRDGIMAVNNSTIAENTAYVSAGISNEGTGTITITGSTIAGNVASLSGGGLYSEGDMATVSNSTISGNSAGTGDSGGVRNHFTTMLISNSTIVGNSASGNGGGLSNSGNTLTVYNTIIANNPSGGDCYDVDATSVDDTNLDSDGTCGDAVQSDSINLGPLQDNGGSTLTHALLANSVAINAGDSAICAAVPVNNLDQRGVVRPQGAGCDIGAYEAQLATVTIVQAGSGTGSVSSEPTGIDCGTTCATVWPINSVITLTAVSDPNSYFSDWSGDVVSADNPITLTVDSDKTITATFTFVPPPVTYTLTVTLDGTGQGTVNSDIVGIACAPDCSASFEEGTVVTLTAVPETGSIFAGWQGACSGLGDCVVTMDEARMVTAVFNTIPTPSYFVYLPLVTKP